MQWLGGALFKWALEWLWSKLAQLFNQWQKDKANHDEAEKDAENQTDKLKKVESDDNATAEDISKAIDDVSKRF